MSTTPPAATAHRLLISFLLAAVVFEGWAIYGLSRRLSRLEARSGLGLSALGSPGGRPPEGPDDPTESPSERRPGRDKEGQPALPEDGMPRGERPEGPEGAAEGAADGEPRGPRDPEDQPRGKPGGGGPTLERLAVEEKYIEENLESYLKVTDIDDATAAGLRAEIDRVFAIRRAELEQGPPDDADQDARARDIEADHKRSIEVFTNLLGEDEAQVFISEVMRPPPGERRPPPPDQEKR